MAVQNTLKDYHKVLQRTLRKSSDSFLLINNLAHTLEVNFEINKPDDLTENDQSAFPFSYPLHHNGTEYGTILCNCENGAHIADVINALVTKEIQKKNVGTEVLGLYREINMIYNFSELISEKIDVQAISISALTEAMQILDATHGSVFVRQEENGDIEQVARSGSNPDPNIKLEHHVSNIQQLMDVGTSAIVPFDEIKNNSIIQHLDAVMYAPLKVKNRVLGLIVLGSESKKEFVAADLKLLTTIALQSATAIESAQLYQKRLREAQERENTIRTIHEASQKFVPTEFIKSLGKNQLTDVVLGDKVEREVTVVFVDIRGFTTLSEVMTPRENFDFVNSFNNRMGPIIRAHEGFIMQYLGDGFMALFPQGTQDALRASIAMQQELQIYNKERIIRERIPVNMGVGMQNGHLIMGITGDEKRLDAAIISDTVNTAARIEGLSKHYGTSIMLTQGCLDNLSDQSEFHFRYLGPVRVKGKEKPIDLYECIDGDAPTLSKHKLKTRKNFETGMELYFNRDFAVAAVTFQKIVKKNEDDLPARLFLNRSAHLITKDLDEHWQGIEAMETK